MSRLHRYLGRPQINCRTLYRRVRQVAVWRRPNLFARGDPAREAVVAIAERLRLLPAGAVVWVADETHLNLLPPCQIHHARTVREFIAAHPVMHLWYGARYSPHDNPIECLWAALKHYLANTRRLLADPQTTGPRLLPQPLTRPAPDHCRTLDQPLVPGQLPTELWKAA